MNKRFFNVLIFLIASFFLLFVPVAYAEEIEEQNGKSIETVEELTEEVQDEEEKQEEVGNIAPTAIEEPQTGENEVVPTATNNSQTTGSESQFEEYTVAVITKKVDENGNPLSGAVLQILDSEGNVVDEWTSDGTEHETLLPEGNYVLHEVSAPEGYKLASDKAFTVKAEVIDIDAGVDFSETPCPHYEGTPLYYVEIEGKKYEVYCINQDWETPDGDSIYDGAVLNPSDIRDYTTQTVYVDAHQNKERKDISDQSLSSQELYNKILDIIYRRQKASSIFTDLTEAEIRYVTEAALKNYTNAGLTRVQGIRIASAPEGYDLYDYYINGAYLWYLYPWYRSFIYDPDAPLGQDIFKTVIGEGDAFGTLARHWSDPGIVNGIITGHNARNNEEVRQKVARFYELYQYLINGEETHPSDMHLYIFSTNDKKVREKPGYNFDDGSYQNLLGIHWYNPYDEKHVVRLTYENKPKEEKREYKNPKTGDNILAYMALLPLSLGGLLRGISSINRKDY